MKKKKDKITVDEYKRFVQRRDQHLIGIQRDPALAIPSGTHVSFAILEAWVDGAIGDRDIVNYMQKYKDCERCEKIYQHYLAQKTARGSRVQRGITG